MSDIVKPEKSKREEVCGATIHHYAQDVRQDQQLLQALQYLPKNYDFEIPKTIQRIRDLQKVKNDSGKEKGFKVVLQFPEGFLMYACLITDILTNFTSAECVILTDVTYGACCVEDITGFYMEADLLVHYGHSCLIPIDETTVPTLYIFVDIAIDVNHLVKTIEANFPDKEKELTLLGTIQYNNSVFATKKQLQTEGYFNVGVPQDKPRSPGEVLGCTAPKMSSACQNKIVVFIADGRFHMEASMIQNPDWKFYQYDPMNKVSLLFHASTTIRRKSRLRNMTLPR